MTKLTDFITPVEAADNTSDDNFLYKEFDFNKAKQPLGTYLKQKLEYSRKNNRKIDDLLQNKIDKDSRSEKDFTLTKELKWEGYDIQEVANILCNFKHGKHKEQTKREIIRAYNRAENPFLGLDQAYIDKIANQPNPLTSNKLTLSEGEQPKRLRAIDGGTDTGKISGQPLLKGLIDQNTITVIYGQSNVGKSFVATDIAAHIASGDDWGDHKLKRQMGVLYVCAEAGASYGKRLVATKRRLGIEQGTALNNWPFQYIAMGVNFLSSKQDIKDVVLLAKQQANKTGIPIGMIVVDTLATTFSGGNENSSEDMGKFIEHMKWMQEHAHCSIVIVHHSGKDQAAGARGHSSLRAATDTELEVVSEKKGERYHRAIKTKKQRDGESDTQIKFGLQVVELWNDEDGDPVTTCHVVLENDAEFEDITPSIMDGLEPVVRDAWEAICFYEDNFNHPPVERLSEKQTKTILFDHINRATDVFDFDDVENVIGDLAGMAIIKHNGKTGKAFDRACEVLSQKGMTLENRNKFMKVRENG